MKFEDIAVQPADLEAVTTEYAEIAAAVDGGGDGRKDALRRWNDRRNAIDTWGALVHLHFAQDTRDEKAKAAREAFDEAEPKFKELAVNMMRRLVESPDRAALEQELGSHALELWETAMASYDPVIEQDSVRESKLQAEYQELLASAEIPFRGETYNLSTLGKFREDPDRGTRHEATQKRWEWQSGVAERLDAIYGELVALRTGMAKKLGYENFIGMAYKRLSRTDYGQPDVERYRAAVRDEVVPLAVELRKQQQARLGVDKLMAWDEGLFDPRGNPKPMGDRAWMTERAAEMFREMGGGLDTFFELMVDRNLLDLDSRDGKAGGGFCTYFAVHGVPFIFANFNGTKGDVEVFTHEVGHAFQGYSSRAQFPLDYVWPTAEACEIHSMSLEFLTYPHMEKFFGDDAARFRRTHLAGALLFLPYGVAIDHFQHLVYENPAATPAERLLMWKEMEATYLPWRDYGDLARPAAGGFWQSQLHVYLYPFYYIDYTLAQACALQFWTRSRKDPQEALDAYVALCRRGGEAPFQQLCAGAGLTSPFADGCLTEVVAAARQELGI